MHTQSLAAETQRCVVARGRTQALAGARTVALEEVGRRIAAFVAAAAQEEEQEAVLPLVHTHCPALHVETRTSAGATTVESLGAVRRIAVEGIVVEDVAVEHVAAQDVAAEAAAAEEEENTASPAAMHTHFPAPHVPTPSQLDARGTTPVLAAARTAVSLEAVLAAQPDTMPQSVGMALDDVVAAADTTSAAHHT